MRSLFRILTIVLLVVVFAVAQRKPDLSWQIVFQDDGGTLHTELVFADNIIQAIGNFQAVHPENPAIMSANRRFFVTCQ